MSQPESRIDQMITRLCEITGVETIPSLAEKLMISPNTIYTARRNNTLPYDKIIRYLLEHNISADTVFYGVTEQNKDILLSIENSVLRYNVLDIYVGEALSPQKCEMLKEAAEELCRGELYGRYVLKCNTPDRIAGGRVGTKHRLYIVKALGGKYQSVDDFPDESMVVLLVGNRAVVRIVKTDIAGISLICPYTGSSELTNSDEKRFLILGCVEQVTDVLSGQIDTGPSWYEQTFGQNRP